MKKKNYFLWKILLLLFIYLYYLIYFSQIFFILLFKFSFISLYKNAIFPYNNLDFSINKFQESHFIKIILVMDNKEIDIICSKIITFITYMIIFIK